MAEAERFEAVVVGGGPAGLAAAYRLADKGVQTLLLERGKHPGAKNVTGGILYGQTNTDTNLDDLLPNFKEAPVERPIDDYIMHCLGDGKVKTLDISRLHKHEHKWSYSVLRAPFDKWFGEQVHKKAKENGGGILSNVRVKGPLIEDGRIVGVETDELDPIYADYVVAADGATSEMVRKAGLRDWGEPENWFQGAKIVIKMPSEKAVEERFGLGSGRGTAHLFAGDLFSGVRGGGFMYTNKDTLSIGTVFHLDSLADSKVSPHALMDRLVEHPMVQGWIGDEAEEIEYSAKLVPDGKKMALKTPYRDNMVAIGDAAGQLQAMGPVIKGMNLGVSAGMYAADAFIDAKAAGKAGTAAKRFAATLKKSYVQRSLRPMRYRVAAYFGENEFANDLLKWSITNALGRRILKSQWGLKRVQNAMASPRLAMMNPDIDFGYVSLPAAVAAGSGETVDDKGQVFHPRSLADRIAALSYDTDIGKPHIILQDAAPSASGKAVHTCPVSARGFTNGCYRIEEVKTPDGGSKEVVAFDVQPCIECGTCAIMAVTSWEHPRGGKGVQYKQG
ncbi:MAG: FAD-dependent oxidoreductase [Euryarchaeota archaeon]|nr:FAD-dependent oxidoreductase [Euryarchaeota archaeon]